MIDVALLSVIRRWHFREGMPIREITRRIGLSRNTVRKYLSSGAKETLCFLQRQDLDNPCLYGLYDDFALRCESPIDEGQSMPTIDKEYRFLGLRDFDLSYAWRFNERHPIHRALADLQANSAVSLNYLDGKIELRHQGMTVTVLSKKAQQAWLNKLDRIRSVRIIVMITRYKTDSDVQY